MIDRVANVIYNEEIYLIRKTTLIFSEPWEQVAEADKALLEKILQAVKLSLHDVAIVHQQVLDLGALSIQPRKAIYFGKPVNGLVPFEVLVVNGMSLVICPPLSTLHEDSASKGKLWTALKALFRR
jgi:DNA polymerase III psi subunit